MKNEATTNEILEAVNVLSDHIDQRFNGVDQRFDRLEARTTHIEATMVTKDYHDEKLADLRGDLVVLMRKEDKKVQSLIEILCSKKVISTEEAKRILSMEPFPQISL